jgi:hypothetical protein
VFISFFGFGFVGGFYLFIFIYCTLGILLLNAEQMDQLTMTYYSTSILFVKLGTNL